MATATTFLVGPSRLPLVSSRQNCLASGFCPNTARARAKPNASLKTLNIKNLKVSFVQNVVKGKIRREAHAIPERARRPLETPCKSSIGERREKEKESTCSSSRLCSCSLRYDATIRSAVLLSGFKLCIADDPDSNVYSSLDIPFVDDRRST